MNASHIAILCALGPLGLLLSACGPEPDGMAVYRANVGKMAFNPTNGVERGRIVGVEVINGGADTVYRVNREGRVTSAPVSGVVVRDATSSAESDAEPVVGGDSVDPTLENAAAEFRGRLTRTGGQLRKLTNTAGQIVAAWTSEECGSFQSEVTDLLVSLNREYTGVVQSIEVERACGPGTRTLSLSGTKYDRYRSGQIGDAELFQ